MSEFEKWQILRQGVKDLGLGLTEQQFAQYSQYYDLLNTWNERINLTSLTTMEDVQVRHFLDSLAVAVHGWRAVDGPNPHQPRETILDIGTGGGFPGLVLKIAFPELELTLLDSIGKKMTFLEEVVNVLELKGVKFLVGRAEDYAQLPEYRESFAIVVARAVAELKTLFEYTLPFCALGGLFCAPKKGLIAEEIAGAQGALRKLGGEMSLVEAYRLPNLAEQRYIVNVRKTQTTPAKYPRRAGIPSRKPLS